MSHTVISVENVSKRYRLGLIGGGTLHDDFERWWARVRGKPDPLLKIGQEDHGHQQGEYIWALRDVSFEVQQGEVLGIIGRNGAGKSTLLKILSRVTAPTSGQVKVKGRVASLLEVGTGFHPELTGRENIYLNGAILGMKKAEIERKFDEIVAFAEIEKFIDTPVKRYSSGMYVRLAFAVAAHLEPENLLVDEVLAVGDAAFQKKCLGKMGDVAKEGRTVLFVSHNMGAMSSLTQSCLCLETGHIVDQGETDRVIQNYLSRVSEQASAQGWADLALAPHVAGRRDIAVLEWVRTINSQGEQSGIFFEGEPISIEIGFSVKEPIKSIELAHSVRSMNNSPLFISPSRQRQVMQPGRYTISSVIEPNHLQAGVCNLNLYLFVGGQKEDVVAPALQFTIEAQLSQDDNPFHIKWSRGYFFRFDHEWGDILPFGGKHESD